MSSIIREFSPALSSIKSPQAKCKIIINNYGSPISPNHVNTTTTDNNVTEINVGNDKMTTTAEHQHKENLPPLPNGRRNNNKKFRESVPIAAMPPMVTNVPVPLETVRMQTANLPTNTDLSTFANRRLGNNEQEVEVTYNAEELYKHLAIAFSKILKSNNIKLVSNLIDLSGKILLDIRDLVQAIALICNVELSDIRIEYEDAEVGCFGTASPIKPVTSIKVGSYDFTTKYNRQANILRDMFSVSLSKVIVNSLIM